MFGQVRRLLASPELVARTITAVRRENSTAEDTDLEEGDVIDALGALEPVWDELYRRSRHAPYGRRIEDGEVMTAWQQACPTRAIVFGNLHSAVARPERARATMRCSPSSTPGRAPPTWPRSELPIRAAPRGSLGGGATVHPESLVAPGVGYPSVTEDVASVPLRFPSPRAWWIGFGLSTLTLASTTGGAPADTRTCTFRFESTDFARPTPACLLTTTGAYDALDVVVGWDGATTGSPTLDALSLTRG